MSSACIPVGAHWQFLIPKLDNQLKSLLLFLISTIIELFQSGTLFILESAKR